MKAETQSETETAITCPTAETVGKPSSELSPRTKDEALDTGDTIVTSEAWNASQGQASTPSVDWRVTESIGEGDFYAWVPLRHTIFESVMCCIPTFLYYVAMRWADSISTESTMWIRAAHNLPGPHWIAGWTMFCVMSELCVCERASVWKAALSAMFLVCTCMAFGAIPYIGIISQSMGGIFIHSGAMGHWAFITLKKKHGFWPAFAAFRYFAVSQAIFFGGVGVQGLGAMLWWPWLVKQIGLFAGIVLSVYMFQVENGSVTILSWNLEHWGQPNRRDRAAASYATQFTHAACEAFRLAIVFYGAIRNPDSKAWIVSAFVSFFLNILGRLGWQKFAAWRLTGNTFFLPTLLTAVHGEAKFAFGYPRFFLLPPLMACRWALGSKGPFYFNEMVVIILITVFFFETLEDWTVKKGVAKKWTPNYLSSIRKSPKAVERSQSPFSLFAAEEGEDGQMKLRSRRKLQQYDQLSFSLGIVCPAFALVQLAMIQLLGVNCVIGTCDCAEVPASLLWNGALLWRPSSGSPCG